MENGFERFWRGVNPFDGFGDKVLAAQVNEAAKQIAEATWRAAVKEKDSEISQLRHDLRNEQAASRMAHEVVARNKALEAENAQLRHALANAQVAAGFAKEMGEKVKVMEAELADLRHWAKYQCPRCHGIGEITVISGQTPENYSQDNIPCPDCVGAVIEESEQRGFIRGLEKGAEIAGRSCDDCARDILSEVEILQP